MGRVLRAYDRASLAAVYKIDDAAATVRDIDDTIWEETEDKAYAEDAEYDTWKRQAREELSDFEEQLRFAALRSLYAYPSAAASLAKRPRVEVAPDAGLPKLDLNGGGGGGGGFGDAGEAPPPPVPEKDKEEADEGL